MWNVCFLFCCFVVLLLWLRAQEGKIGLSFENIKLDEYSKRKKRRKKRRKENDKKNFEEYYKLWKVLYHVATKDINYYENMSEDDFNVNNMYTNDILFYPRERESLSTPLLSRDDAISKMRNYVQNRLDKKGTFNSRQIELLCTFGCSGSGKTRMAHEFLTNSRILSLFEPDVPVIRIATSYGHGGSITGIDEDSPEAGLGWRMLIAFINITLKRLLKVHLLII